jgi:hypothetical protein
MAGATRPRVGRNALALLANRLIGSCASQWAVSISRTWSREYVDANAAEHAQRRETKNRDGETLSQMAELLQCCAQRSEAYEIVRDTGALLFPASRGSLFI